MSAKTRVSDNNGGKGTIISGSQFESIVFGWLYAQLFGLSTHSEPAAMPRARMQMSELACWHHFDHWPLAEC